MNSSPGTCWWHQPKPRPPASTKVNADLRRVATQPDFRQRIEGLGGEVVSMTARQSADYLNGEFTRWAKVVKDRNIQAD